MFNLISNYIRRTTKAVIFSGKGFIFKILINGFRLKTNKYSDGWLKEFFKRSNKLDVQITSRKDKAEDKNTN